MNAASMVTCRHQYFAVAQVWDSRLGKWERGPLCWKCHSIKLAWRVDEPVE